MQIDNALGRLGPGNVRVEGLTAPAGTEALTRVAGQPTLLNVAGSSLDYAATVSVVRLRRAGAVVHVARITGLSAQLALDQAVPPAVGANFSVRAAVSSGNYNATLTSATVFTFTSGSAPGVGSGVLVGPAATAIRDRPVGGGAGGDGRPRPHVAGRHRRGRHVADARARRRLGTHSGVPGAPRFITYARPRPERRRTLASSGCRAPFPRPPRDGSQPRRHRPGPADSGRIARPVDAERFRASAPDVSGVIANPGRDDHVIRRSPNTTTAFHIVRFAGGPVAAGALLVSGTLAG